MATIRIGGQVCICCNVDPCGTCIPPDCLTLTITSSGTCEGFDCTPHVKTLTRSAPGSPFWFSNDYSLPGGCSRLVRWIFTCSSEGFTLVLACVSGDCSCVDCLTYLQTDLGGGADPVPAASCDPFLWTHTFSSAFAPSAICGTPIDLTYTVEPC